MKQTNKTKKIKNSITDREYKKLINATRGNEQLRQNTKNNLLRTFTVLYYTGLRLNEIQNLKIADIKTLLKEGELTVSLPKTKNQRKLFLSDNFKKDLNKLDLSGEDDFNLIQRAGHPRSKISEIGFITLINKHIKEILGEGYSSHSFRQGLLTEMASKGVNVKIMKEFIGHSDVKTTLQYVKPTDEQIMMNLVR